MAAISGTLDNAGTTVWVVAAYDYLTDALAASVETSSGLYTLPGLTAGQAYTVLVFPKLGGKAPKAQGPLIAT